MVQDAHLRSAPLETAAHAGTHRAGPRQIKALITKHLQSPYILYSRWEKQDPPKKTNKQKIHLPERHSWESTNSSKFLHQNASCFLALSTSRTENQPANIHRTAFEKRWNCQARTDLETLVRPQVRGGASRDRGPGIERGALPHAYPAR